MKKNVLIYCTSMLLCLALGVKAQDADTTYWKKDFRAGISFNQASFSDNWLGGGVNSIGLNGFLNYKANYTKDVHTWDNEIDLAYGVLKNEGQSSRKSVDRLFLDSKYGRKLSDKWNFYTSLSFLSQFAPGYEYDVVIDDNTGEIGDNLISDLFAPAFLTASTGFEYAPVDYFKVRVGPFSPRFTFVSNDELAAEGAFGVDPGDNVRAEWFGFQLMADFNKDIAENLNLKWKYIMYANYEELEARKIDHRLDLFLSAKVNSFIDLVVVVWIFCIHRLNCQSPSDEVEAPLNFEGIEPTEYLTHQPDTTVELNIKGSYDDLLDVSTTYLSVDLVHYLSSLLSNNPLLSYRWQIARRWKARYPIGYRSI